MFFLYAGARFPAPRGSLYWPHRASVSHNGKRWPYFIVDEGGPRMQGLSVLCHEFGHMLGLPDLYARPENPGMEGLGVWCNMSQQPNRMIPQHFGAWVEGEARLAQADGHRPDRQAEAGPRPDRELAEGMLQGPDPSRRLGVPPPGEPPEDGIRPEPAGRRPPDLARPRQPAHPEGVARDRGACRASRPPERGAVPRARRMTPIPLTRRRRAGRRSEAACRCDHQHPPPRGWPDRVPYRVRISMIALLNPFIAGDPRRAARKPASGDPTNESSLVPEPAWSGMPVLRPEPTGRRLAGETGPSEYRTIKDAQTRVIVPPRPGRSGQTGYLGVSVAVTRRVAWSSRRCSRNHRPRRRESGRTTSSRTSMAKSLKTPERLRDSLQSRGPR